ERIVFLSGVDRPEDGLQFEIRNTVTLAEAGPRRTELTLEVEVLSATDAARPNITGAEMGWTQSLDRLVSYVHGYASLSSNV
ncbi:MAG TPA: SRPBCC domain-containing protein, partial [Bryobacteraceae bacterium]